MKIMYYNQVMHRTDRLKKLIEIRKTLKLEIIGIQTLGM